MERLASFPGFPTFFDCVFPYCKQPKTGESLGTRLGLESGRKETSGKVPFSLIPST